MGLKSLNQNYTKLLKAFDEVGVKLNESQKESLDTFMIDLEKKINETRDNAIRATKKVVEEKLEKEYKEVVKNLISHQSEVSELAGKVQSEVTKVNESKKLAEQLDNYLDCHLDEVLPKKVIVDYDEMQKLRTLHESLKDMLLVNDSAVEEKVESIKKSMTKETDELKTKVQDLENKLNESMKKELSLNKRLDESKAREMIGEKIKDLPILEAKEMKKRLAGMTSKEVEKNFKTILESVEEEIKDQQIQNEDEKNLEEAITDILEDKTEEKKDDTSDKNGADTEEGKETNSEDAGDDETIDESDEPESVEITESQMQSWIDTLKRLTPQ